MPSPSALAQQDTINAHFKSHIYHAHHHGNVIFIKKIFLASLVVAGLAATPLKKHKAPKPDPMGTPEACRAAEYRYVWTTNFSDCAELFW